MAGAAVAWLLLSLTGSAGTELSFVERFVKEARTIARSRERTEDISHVAERYFTLGTELSTHRRNIERSGFRCAAGEHSRRRFVLCSKTHYWGMEPALLLQFSVSLLVSGELRLILYTEDGVTLSRAAAYLFLHGP
jgi:hypothetical protein